MSLNLMAGIVLLVSTASAAVVAGDILAGRWQKMAIMNLVWPLTTLYFGPIGVWAYWAMRQPAAGQGHGGRDEQRDGGSGAKKPFWQTVFVATSHCGAGRTVGDVPGETGIFLLGRDGYLPAGAHPLWLEAGTASLIDFALAYAFGIMFQYFTIAPMRGLGVWDGLKAAVKADTMSLVAFEVGMFGAMALYRLVLFDRPPEPDSAAYWFLMQLAMIVGFATSYPANWWLVRAGLKEAM